MLFILCQSSEVRCVDEEQGIATHNCSSSLLREMKSVYCRKDCAERGGKAAHLDPAVNLTVSFTCSTVFGFACSFFPPPADMAIAAVPISVPSARYSFLMARPKMTLRDVHNRVRELNEECRSQRMSRCVFSSQLKASNCTVDRTHYDMVDWNGGGRRKPAKRELFGQFRTVTVGGRISKYSEFSSRQRIRVGFVSLFLDVRLSRGPLPTGGHSCIGDCCLAISGFTGSRPFDEHRIDWRLWAPLVLSSRSFQPGRVCPRAQAQSSNLPISLTSEKLCAAGGIHARSVLAALIGQSLGNDFARRSICCH